MRGGNEEAITRLGLVEEVMSSCGWELGSTLNGEVLDSGCRGIGLHCLLESFEFLTYRKLRHAGSS
jgi:hypothetical protein